MKKMFVLLLLYVFQCAAYMRVDRELKQSYSGHCKASTSINIGVGAASYNYYSELLWPNVCIDVDPSIVNIGYVSDDEQTQWISSQHWYQFINATAPYINDNRMCISKFYMDNFINRVCENIKATQDFLFLMDKYIKIRYYVDGKMLKYNIISTIYCGDDNPFLSRHEMGPFIDKAMQQFENTGKLTAVIGNHREGTYVAMKWGNNGLNMINMDITEYTLENNLKWLQNAIDNDNYILLVTNRISEGSLYEQEINYLKQRGYHRKGNHMIKPKIIASSISSSLKVSDCHYNTSQY